MYSPARTSYASAEARSTRKSSRGSASGARELHLGGGPWGGAAHLHHQGRRGRIAVDHAAARRRRRSPPRRARRGTPARRRAGCRSRTAGSRARRGAAARARGGPRGRRALARGHEAAHDRGRGVGRWRPAAAASSRPSGASTVSSAGCPPSGSITVTRSSPCSSTTVADPGLTHQDSKAGSTGFSPAARGCQPGARAPGPPLAPGWSLPVVTPWPPAPSPRPSGPARSAPWPARACRRSRAS